MQMDQKIVLALTGWLWGWFCFTVPSLSQCDLCIAMHDLFIRHELLSVNQVEGPKKRVDMNTLKLESVIAVAKKGWEEADRTTGSIKKDKATISAQSNWWVFFRAW
jgi:hypothetical protein